ncbi:hypothetical protein [Nocardioides limicola]|uniref:hypothetical protein n=1 Tax=Nocardioides limicola TaxID=2803368 RepID=UPI00193B0865|nr:hypothetical protein [Nocardioides sp. DJM-14]
MEQPILVAAAVVAALAIVAALVWLSLLVTRMRHEAATVRAEAAELREMIDTMATASSTALVKVTSDNGQVDYVITALGEESLSDVPVRDESSGNAESQSVELAVPQRIEGKLFADIVLRETLIKAAAAASGVRRAFSAEHRNQVRFEMRREIKRARKQRKAELKAARRLIHERQRAALNDEDAA